MSASMANPQTLSNGEAIEKRAVEWLMRRDTGRLNEVEEQELNSWLLQSSRHAVAYYRLEAAWAAADRLKVLGAASRRPAKPARKIADVRVMHYLAAAASVLLTFGFYLLGHRAFDGYRYSTPIGGVATLPLADGSWVTLNTDSVIRIGLTPTVRRVELERGEAFFSVAKDRSRPFIVIANDKSITAVGTEFAVRKDGVTTRVIVAEGRVRFATPASKATTPISAGEVGEAGRSGSIVVQDKSIAELEGSLSWRHGFVVFHDTPLAEVVADLNRYNSRKMQVRSPATAAIQICGAIRIDNIDGFMRLMKDEFEMEIGSTAESPPLPRNEAPPVEPVNVPPGDLVAALDDVAKHPRLQVLYRCEQLLGFQTMGASGYFTGPQALAKLTQGTLATLRTDPSGAVFVDGPRHVFGPY
jgi:transmembrane sensor